MTDVIREHGVDYVTVANICKAAKVPVGSFYHYFGRKDELPAHYLIEAFDRRADEFEWIDSGNVVGDLVEYYRLYNAFLLDQGLPFIRTVHRILRTGRERGQLMPDCDIERLIYDMSVLEKGVLFDWCLCDGEYNLQGEVTRLLNNYLQRFVK